MSATLADNPDYADGAQPSAAATLRTIEREHVHTFRVSVGMDWTYMPLNSNPDVTASARQQPCEPGRPPPGLA